MRLEDNGEIRSAATTALRTQDGVEGWRALGSAPALLRARSPSRVRGLSDDGAALAEKTAWRDVQHPSRDEGAGVGT
jgi:hypothetical protein